MYYKQILGAGLVAVSAMASSVALANDWPSRAVTIVVPFAPGGSTDVVARMMAEKMAERFGAPFIVENKPGASTTIASAHVAQAKPDGYTLYIGTMNMHAIDKVLYPSATYDGIGDFTHITKWVSFPMVVVANPEKGLKDLNDLVALAKENPGKVTHSSAGVGSSNHLAAVLFMQATGTKLYNIPYKGGNPATLAVMSGEVDVSFATPPSAIPALRSERAVALGLSSQEPSSLFPDVKSSAQAGVPGYDFRVWHGFYGPAGIPDDIVQKLFEASKSILEDTEVKAQLAGLGMESDPSESVEQFNEFVNGVAVDTQELAVAVQNDH